MLIFHGCKDTKSFQIKQLSKEKVRIRQIHPRNLIDKVKQHRSFLQGLSPVLGVKNQNSTPPRNSGEIDSGVGVIVF